MVYYPADDVKTNIESFYLATSQILKYISTRDQKQTDRLIKLISEADGISDKNSNSEILIEFACLIAKSNPTRAYQIGVGAFKTKQPDNFHKLYWQLRRYSPGLADRFIELALASAANSPNAGIFAGIKTAVFPELSIPNFPPEASSPAAIKTGALNLLGDHIVKLYAKLMANSTSGCEAEASVISSLREQYSSLLPQKEPMVTQAVSACLAKQNEANRNLSSNSETIKKGTIEELLKLADEAKDDLQVRSFYLFRAVSLASDQEKYKLAIEILGNMTKEEQQTDPEFWEDLQVTVTAGLAYQQFKENDPTAATRTLGSLPTKNRAFGEIGFIRKFSPENIDSQDICIALLREAAKDIARSENTFEQKSGYWFQIVKLFANYKMYDHASETLKDVFLAFNKSETPSMLAAERLTPIVSPAFFEAQESSILNAVNLIDQNRSRVNVSFALLNIVMKRYETLRAEESRSS